MYDEDFIVNIINSLIRSSYAREYTAKEPDNEKIENDATLLLNNLGIENFHFSSYYFEEQGFRFKCPQVYLNRYHG